MGNEMGGKWGQMDPKEAEKNTLMYLELGCLQIIQ